MMVIRTCRKPLLALMMACLLLGRGHASEQLTSLEVSHPRLLLHDQDLPHLREAIARQPFVKAQYEEQLADGKLLLDIKPDTYQLSGAERSLLTTAREVEGRIILLAGLYRVSGYKPFAIRAKEEMLSAARFPDWDPTHFLDTAELTAGLGIGYDWLYGFLSVEDRTTIRNAITTKGIDPWLLRISRGNARMTNNWSQVCNGGETMGALAIAEDEPERAIKVLDHAKPAIADIMKLFAPDGGFEEGPTYWNYATMYNVLYISALQTALGTDFGATDASGFSETGMYHLQSISPIHLLANFGDSRPESFPAGEMYWLANTFNKPIFAVHERNEDIYDQQRRVEQTKDGKTVLESAESLRFGFLRLVWSSQVPSFSTNTSLPTVQSFKRVNQSYIRGSWNDSNAWYIAFKGGDAQASHGHLDLGTFVLDALGQRWAEDLGADSYGLPNYFNKGRWDYYRTGTAGHNTLVVNGLNQDLDAEAQVVSYGSKGGHKYSIVNLDQAYKGKLANWSRGVQLLDDQRVLIQDEFKPSIPVDVMWSMHTKARVSLSPDGRSAILSSGGKQMKLVILDQSSAIFSMTDVERPAPESSNKGVMNLVIRLKQQSIAETVAILFTVPQDKVLPPIKELSLWP